MLVKRNSEAKGTKNLQNKVITHNFVTVGDDRLEHLTK
jgi:hypothetical protein